MYGEGISREGDLLDLAVDRKIVEKSGTWFAYSGERLGQGRENVKQFLKDNPTIFKSIEEKVRKELGLDGAPKEVPAAATAEPATPAPAARGAGR
jgi:recombination protein RecA